jgi:recombination protein RecA
MANPALAVLEDALRSRKLDRTICLPDRLNGVPGGAFDRPDPASCASTGIETLDDGLKGGLPRGQLSEIAGPRSSGRTTLLTQMLAAATRRGELAALVDTGDRFDAASAAAAGVDLDRLLWIRGEGADDRPVERALKALNLVLQAGGFGLVALDLADVPAAALARIPFTTWPRIQRTLEGSETAGVLIGPHPIARSAGGLTLLLTGTTRWSRRVEGLDVGIRVVSPRQRVQGDIRVCCDSRD